MNTTYNIEITRWDTHKVVSVSNFDSLERAVAYMSEQLDNIWSAEELLEEFTDNLQAFGSVKQNAGRGVNVYIKPVQGI